MRRTLIPVLLSVAATLAVLAAIEATVRLAGVQPLEWPAAGGGVRFRGIEADPLLGPLLRPGWGGVWPGKFPVQVDARGFRATGFPPLQRPHARVVFMGDSCTFGWAMDTASTFVAQLDARQRATGTAGLDLMNAGYPGQSAVVGEYVLRERLLAFRPDVVVIGYSANNAFRLSVTADVERFRFFRARKLLLRSRLLHLVAAWVANRNPPQVSPRDRETVLRTPLRDVQRVATAAEFAAAMRALVTDARRHGAAPLFLVFPRASGVSPEHAVEDAGLAARRLRPGDAGGNEPGTDEIGLLEVSCLDHHAENEPLRVLHQRAAAWQPVYPSAPPMRALLREGALAYQRGDSAEAEQRFTAALALEPSSPLARYDLGAAKLTRGGAGGMADLAEADRLACNVFLQYQIIVWRLATELGVPVVDLTLHFQAHDGEPLFLDPAHPNAAGHRIIADALWPAILSLVPQRS